MSAYIVSKGHIRFLVEAAGRLSRDPVSWHGPLGRRSLSRFIKNPGHQELTPNQLGRLLWEENFRSVRYRYSDSSELPGPVPNPDPAEYEHVRTLLPIDPVQVFATLSCYEYQSCENEDWPESEAKIICDAIKDAAIRALPDINGTVSGVPEEWEDEVGNKVIALTDLM